VPAIFENIFLNIFVRLVNISMLYYIHIVPACLNL
jgi:hypothetical protein